MTEIKTIVAGQSSWDKLVDANFKNIVEKLDGMIVSDTDWTSEGITLLNGTIPVDDFAASQPMYRMIKINTGVTIARIISVRASMLKFTAKTDIISLPSDLVSPNYRATGFSFGNQLYRATWWNSIPNKTATIHLDTFAGTDGLRLDLETTLMY